jgi:23S rRNA-/tRNA-specific pseudouridylate synthase
MSTLIPLQAYTSSQHVNSRPGDVFVTFYSPSGIAGSPPTTLSPCTAALRFESTEEPLIYHVVAPCGLLAEGKRYTLLDLLAAHTILSVPLLIELCKFGACYASVGRLGHGVSPRPPRLDLPALLLQIPPCNPVYARVHVRPRRYRMLWPLRLLYICEELVFVDKPAGIPVQPTQDNAVENARVEAEMLLAAPRGTVDDESAKKSALYVTTRLDVGTSGCLCLARHSRFVGAANTALGDAQKRYLVLTRNQPRLGLLRHWLRKKPRLGRGEVRESLVREWDDGDERESREWCRGQLKVERVTRVGSGEVWESTVRLDTGRVHQIRLMFAANGWWLFGDEKYANVGGGGRIEAGGVLADSSDKHGLHVIQLELEWRGQSLTVDAGPAWWHQPGALG